MIRRLTLAKAAFNQAWTNLRGWRTRRKLIVIESDDWGAIRMPSRGAWERLLAAGIRVDSSPYDRLDCLESGEDLQILMNVLNTKRDSRGCPAIFTFNTVMGNPDFSAIEADDFTCFHHQHFFESYRYFHGESLENAWQQAISDGLMLPQFHGKEHINVPLWLSDLKSGQSETRKAFYEQFYGLTTKTSSARQFNYLASFWAESDSELNSVFSRLKEGLKIFRETFGFDSRTFIACNYILPEQAEPLLLECGIRLIQGQRGHFVPTGDRPGGRIQRFYTGKETASGPTRSVRNVFFEPFMEPSKDWVVAALKEINQAFVFRKPAIISSHRVNFVSGMSLDHRNRNIKMLDSLLAEVLRRWPDVEFLSSDQLLDEMTAS